MNESLILNEEIPIGIFVDNIIIPKNGYKHLRAVNRTDKPAKKLTFIYNLNLQVIPKILINSQINQSRFERIKTLINIDNIDDSSKNDILEIIQGFATYSI